MLKNLKTCFYLLQGYFILPFYCYRAVMCFWPPKLSLWPSLQKGWLMSMGNNWHPRYQKDKTWGLKKVARETVLTYGSKEIVCNRIFFEYSWCFFRCKNFYAMSTNEVENAKPLNGAINATSVNGELCKSFSMLRYTFTTADIKMQILSKRRIV